QYSKNPATVIFVGGWSSPWSRWRISSASACSASRFVPLTLRHSCRRLLDVGSRPKSTTKDHVFFPRFLMCPRIATPWEVRSPSPVRAGTRRAARRSWSKRLRRWWIGPGRFQRPRYHPWFRQRHTDLLLDPSFEDPPRYAHGAAEPDVREPVLPDQRVG